MRYVLIIGAVAYSIFIIINCKAIDDAINCVKLASEVLSAQFILCIQPLYNIILKIFFLAVFAVIIVTAISSSGFRKDDLSFTVPGEGTPYTITIGGMARKLDILDSTEDVGNDI